MVMGDYDGIRVLNAPEKEIIGEMRYQHCLKVFVLLNETYNLFICIKSYNNFNNVSY